MLCLRSARNQINQNMKTLSDLRAVLFLGTLIILVVACKPPIGDAETAQLPQTHTVSSGAEQNIALVHKFLEAQIQGDGVAMMNYMNEDFLSRNPAGDTLRRVEYIENWSSLSETRSNQDLGIFATNGQSVNEGPLTGEWVMFWGTYTAIDNQVERSYEILWHADFLVEDGKISRVISYFDMVDPEPEV